VPQRKNWGEAVEHIDRAIACADNVAVQGILYRYRARYHSELKDDPAALADLDKEIALEAEGGVPSAKPYVLRGRMLQKNQRFEESLASFEAARKVQPGSAEALRGRAEMLFEMRNFPEAILAFNDVIEKAAPTSQDYKLRGLCKSNQGDHQSAAEDYSRALDLETKAVGSEKRTSNMAWLRTHRGNAYLAFQADRPAMTDFEEVLRRDPENAEALCGRGLARVRLGPIDPGVQDVKHALRIEPATSRLSYSCARIYAQAAAKLSSNDRKDRTTLAKIRDLENRALDLIGQALTLLPPSERARFWEHTVAKDGCMAVIRRTSSFYQLEEKYAPRTKDLKRAGSVAGSAVMAR
jgi:tetratricopeptide (TPR) repeat protein